MEETAHARRVLACLIYLVREHPTSAEAAEVAEFRARFLALSVQLMAGQVTAERKAQLQALQDVMISRLHQWSRSRPEALQATFESAVLKHHASITERSTEKSS